VADRARSSAATRETLAQTALTWSTRVPATGREAHVAWAPADPPALAPRPAGSRDHALTSTDGGVAQGWGRIDSEARQPQAQRPVDHQRRHQTDQAVNAFTT
jgi:hypothetical protein